MCNSFSFSKEVDESSTKLPLSTRLNLSLHQDFGVFSQKVDCVMEQGRNTMPLNSMCFKVFYLKNYTA